MAQCSDGPHFLEPVDALAQVTENSLLIIVDTHNKDILESVDLYHAARYVIVIDHHRKNVNFIENAVIFHHEPYASSASEMVTEIIQYFRTDTEISAAYADALLSGIMLDTKNFVMRTGVRTFEAAAYLRKIGADTIQVKTLFSNTISMYSMRAQIVSHAELYRNNAISVVKMPSQDARVLAAQAADELLSIQGVEASFVIYAAEPGAAISARSMGNVNVQVIMEQLGGGGHQTMAAAQLPRCKYGHGRQIDNCIQTNGTLLNDDWCRFFKENNFLVGVSIDGPQEFHDEYRRNKQGLPSFYKVMKGIELMKKHGVEYNAMAVVNDYNVDYPLEFYRFFKEIDCHYIQFTPIVERLGFHQDGTLLTSPEQQDANIKLAPFTVDAGKWGDFLCTVFDEWLKEDVGNYYIQLFDSTLANWVGEQPGVCTLARTCGHAGVMEFNGDVYACDHFVFPEYKLGNIHTQTLTEMMYSQRQLKFGADKHEKLPTQCKECDYLFACNGECPKNRFLHTANGEPGLNYLCKGYKKFFKHVAPYMDFMKKELLAGRPPANVMQWAKENKL